MPPRSHLLLLFCIVTISLVPAFYWGAGGWDLHCQSLAVRHFSGEFWRGNFYPRWLPEMFAGDGSPIFFYYPPLAYYIAALFYPLAPAGDSFSYFPIATSIYIALLVAAAGCYAWLKAETGNAQAALAGSALYITAPSNMAYNFYYLLLYSGVWVYALLPLLMIASKRVALGKPYAIVLLAFLQATLLLTNLPFALIVEPVFLAYALLYLHSSAWKKIAFNLALSVALGFGIAAFFLVPSLSYLSYASIDLAWSRAQMVRTPSIFSLQGDQRFWCIAYWIVNFLLILIMLRYAPKNRSSIFFGGCGLLALFMMLPVSLPIWDLIPILYSIQMSERMLIVSSLCLTMLMAVNLPRMRFFAYGLCTLSLLSTFMVAQQSRMTAEQFKTQMPAQYNAYMHDVDQYALYLPNTSGHALMGRFGTAEGLGQVMKQREQVFSATGDVTATVTLWQSRHIELHYRAPQEATLQVRQFAFPGWRAWAGGKEIAVTRDDPTGEIQLNIPAGEGDIRLELTALFPEVLGKTLSIAALGVTLLLLLLELHKRQKHMANR